MTNVSDEKLLKNLLDAVVAEGEKDISLTEIIALIKRMRKDTDDFLEEILPKIELPKNSNGTDRKLSISTYNDGNQHIQMLSYPVISVDNGHHYLRGCAFKLDYKGNVVQMQHPDEDPRVLADLSEERILEIQTDRENGIALGEEVLAKNKETLGTILEFLNDESNLPYELAFTDRSRDFFTDRINGKKIIVQIEDTSIFVGQSRSEQGLEYDFATNSFFLVNRYSWGRPFDPIRTYNRRALSEEQVAAAEKIFSKCMVNPNPWEFPYSDAMRKNLSEYTLPNIEWPSEVGIQEGVPTDRFGNITEKSQEELERNEVKPRGTEPADDTDTVEESR